MAAVTAVVVRDASYVAGEMVTENRDRPGSTVLYERRVGGRQQYRPLIPPPRVRVILASSSSSTGRTQ